MMNFIQLLEPNEVLQKKDKRLTPTARLVIEEAIESVKCGDRARACALLGQFVKREDA